MKVINTENAILQLTHLNLALIKLLAETNSAHTKVEVSTAAHASQASGYGNELIVDLYRRAFGEDVIPREQ